MDNAIALKAQGLTKDFTRNKRVIDNIDLEIKKGELFCLVGTNGAGKTTLIKILCNLILPTKGEVYINGYSLLRDPEKAKISIGLVTGDERSFYWRLSGRQNIEFFAALYGLTAEKRNKRILELFDLLDIREPDKSFQEYASGIKQRLSIVRALLNDPDILFIDELTKSLDPTSAGNLRHFIKETLVKKQKKAVFFSTHQLYEIEELADRVAFMSKGRIIALGTLSELRKISGKPEATMEEVYRYFINSRG